MRLLPFILTATLLVSASVHLSAQEPSDAEIEAMLEAEAEAMEKMGAESYNYDDGFQNPQALGQDLTGPVIEFYFAAIRKPEGGELYHLEGQDYQLIEPAFQTFGSMHRASKRNRLVFYEKMTKVVEDEEVTFYDPAYEISINNPNQPFAVLLPLRIKAERPQGEVYPLAAIDLSPNAIPRNQITFINSFDRPLAVKIGDVMEVLPAYGTLRQKFKTNARGAGRVRIALAIRETNGGAKKIYDRRIVLSENRRALAIPYLDPGTNAVNVLTHSFE